MIANSNAILSLSGHVHWNTWHSVDRVRYATLQSLTESCTTHPLAAGAYTILELGEDISIEVGGLDRIHCVCGHARLSASCTWSTDEIWLYCIPASTGCNFVYCPLLPRHCAGPTISIRSDD